MARADLIINLVRTSMEGDELLFRKTVEAIAAEERSKRHYALAERLTDLLASNVSALGPSKRPESGFNDTYHVITPRKTLEDLVLPDHIVRTCRDIIEEHHRRDLLRSYNLEPRHKLLLSGPPGNGKTSLAEALAYELVVPLFVVRYEGLIRSYLGETAQQLNRLFEQVKTQRCILFLDEFDALGKERADPNEVGEIKRVVNSLLMQIDMMPSHVVIVGATNHPDLLDKATWRRFQAQLELPKPSVAGIQKWLDSFEKRVGHGFEMSSKVMAEKLKDLSFAEIEEFALDIQRRYVLNLPNSDIKKIVRDSLRQRGLLPSTK